MSKSLIKNVDGIGIWVKEDYIASPNMWLTVATSGGIFLFLISLPFIITPTDRFDSASYVFISLFLAFVAAMMCCVNTMKNIDTYVVYSGSEGEGITVFKTTNPQADQIAICKAAKQIESQCHEIAAKRAELDRIAAGCK